MPPLLGYIADDFTRATDLAGILVERGMRTVLVLDTPNDLPPPDADALVVALVVALNSRTNPVREAIDLSLKALKWLRRSGCRQPRAPL
jgi:uncharacterized protein YgbK (DUF1537 family)